MSSAQNHVGRHIMIRIMMSFAWRTWHAKVKTYLNNEKCKFCGKTIVIEKVKPDDEKDKVQISNKIQFACTCFLKPIELLIMIISHAW